MPHDQLHVSELKLQYTSIPQLDERPTVKCSQDAYAVIKQSWSNQVNLVEEFKIMMLDRRNRVLGISSIAKGGFSAVMVDLKVAFATALLAKSNGIILAHNHPSGNLKPSQQDLDLTQKFNGVGKALGLPILDHIIIREEEGYFSFADECLL